MSVWAPADRGISRPSVEREGSVRVAWVGRVRRAASAAALLVAVAGLAPLGTGGTGTAAPTWAPSSSAAIHPGVQRFTDGAPGTANFIYYCGSHCYIGQT